MLTALVQQQVPTETSFGLYPMVCLCEKTQNWFSLATYWSFHEKGSKQDLIFVPNAPIQTGFARNHVNSLHIRKYGAHKCHKFCFIISQFWNTSEEMTLEIKTPEYATTNDANVIFATQLKPINI